MLRIPAVAIMFATLLAAALHAQPNCSGPTPPKANIPYLVHANCLIETEVGIAGRRRSLSGNQMTYVVSGGRSGVRTPLASPTLLIESDSTDVIKLRLFRLTVKDDRLELTFQPEQGRGSPAAHGGPLIFGSLHRIDVLDSLAPGQYMVSPDGASDAFCFAVFWIARDS